VPLEQGGETKALSSKQTQGQFEMSVSYQTTGPASSGSAHHYNAVTTHSRRNKLIREILLLPIKVVKQVFRTTRKVLITIRRIFDSIE
jgi:hypothetical protein